MGSAGEQSNFATCPSKRERFVHNLRLLDWTFNIPFVTHFNFYVNIKHLYNTSESNVLRTFEGTLSIKYNVVYVILHAYLTFVASYFEFEFHSSVF